ncbi:hypothetical protein [Cerasicoccus arenae]|uniref:Co-chaperone DjlA N-terminal domain-containing protein n=1 Tax=Cerasicoccus arenae TaxID=424488 RepID=A0A8J3DJ78_9BACT|nr:hypothetical protein [Cerasicoccus arenae]MBK1858733.1 hypothetical protein [Cerasicoccus arenae]GHC07204.1 hypothetical protein GCM10007047_25300 [Cerasicoccus arenae]
MLSFFQKLFRAGGDSADGLTQQQREAIVDLLVFCMYSDRTVSLAEDQLIQRRLESMDWQAVQSIDNYYDLAVTRVRDILVSQEARESFLKRVSERLADVSTREKAFQLSHQLFLSDGIESPDEHELEAELRTALLGE